MTKILFYKVNDKYGEFSNFAPFPFSDGERLWPTSEHYFQAQKFMDRALQEKIRCLTSPMEAALEGRNRAYPLRPNWEEIKDDVMRFAVREKFRQHPALQDLLLETGQATLIEHTTNDHYWADGGDGSGKNMLGKILMEVREQLKQKDKLIIRKAGEADVEGIIHVCRSAWSVTYADLHTEDHIATVLDEYYNTERVLKEVTETSREWNGYWVAERDGQVIGCIGGGIDAENAGHIYVFYILPVLKGQGIGTILLKEFTAYQQETFGISEQWVTSVTEGNQMGIPFYEKQGFVFDYATENSKSPHLPRNLHYKRYL